MQVRLPLSPIPAPRPRVTSKGWAYYPKKYRVWREEAALLIPGLLQDLGFKTPMVGAIEMSVDFVATQPKTTKLAYPKGDIDNFLKTLDCFNELLWVDDCLIVTIGASKRWAPLGTEGYIDLTVKEIGSWK
tara:strand:+ start:2952 stop:3344 length:393 start_codon:yes stop_codon:yes gene_type:complete